MLAPHCKGVILKSRDPNAFVGFLPDGRGTPNVNLFVLASVGQRTRRHLFKQAGCLAPRTE